MAILVDETIRLVVQGATGREGSFHTRLMREYGTQVVAGVTPGRGMTIVEGVPVFDTVAGAVSETGANSSIVFVPGAFAPDAIYEAADAGIRLVVCVTEGIPVLDMLPLCQWLESLGVRLIGPNSPGIISPGKSKVGIMPAQVHSPGKVGVVSRSGTLTYEVVEALTKKGLGQSTCLGIGGDPIVGTSFVEVLALFEEDPETEKIVLIGEIGGGEEEAAAEFISRGMHKPVVAYIAGRTAPPGRRMGHAGAIISGGEGSAAAKVAALERAGVRVAAHPAQVAHILAEL